MFENPSYCTVSPRHEEDAKKSALKGLGEKKVITYLSLLPDSVCTACIAKLVEDFDSDDTMDALLKEALTEFEECRLTLAG